MPFHASLVAMVEHLFHPDQTISHPTIFPDNYRSHCQGVDVAMVSRGDSTLRGHFPGDLVSLEKGMGGEFENERMPL